MLDQLTKEPGLVDRVYDLLVSAIASGRLAPGERLTQERVAETLGVSRQPVSHALQLLKHKGLVIEHGRRGLAVAPLDGTRLRHLYQVREAIDALAARLAAERVRQGQAPQSEIAAVEAALKAGSALGEAAETADLVRADVAFHKALYDLSGNPEIAQTVAEQWPLFMRSMGVVLNARDRKRTIWPEHEAIFAAVRAGDAAAGEQLAAGHARRAGEISTRILQQQEAATRPA